MSFKTAEIPKISYTSVESISTEARSSFIFALLFFLVFLTITFLIPPRSGKLGYFAALKDKHHYLETVQSPKILFIGGSNLAFGLDSHLIETTFHKPVVNMGICAPFGLRYILEEVKDNINPGDTVVIVPEYGILQNTVDGSPDLIHALEVYPPAGFFILRAYTRSPQAFFKLLDLIRSLPSAKWNAFYTILSTMWQKGYYDPSLFINWEISNQIGPDIRFYFDKHGDYFGHFGKPNLPFRPAWELVKSMDSEAANLINDFHNFATQRGAQVVLIPPPVPSEYLTPSCCSPISIASWPNQVLTVSILAKPKRYAFAAALFYQPPYHLNIAGRTIRTTLISEDLASYFSKTLKQSIFDDAKKVSL